MEAVERVGGGQFQHGIAYQHLDAESEKERPVHQRLCHVKYKYDPQKDQGI
jgi:hypothetical protein